MNNEKGVTGEKGMPGNYVNGLQGPTNHSGPTGEEGPTGLSLPTELTGQQGVNGHSDPAGEKGDMGWPGINTSKPLATKEQIIALDTMTSATIVIEHTINNIKGMLPKHSSKEKSMFITKLEEAVLWGEKDIKLNHKL